VTKKNQHDWTLPAYDEFCPSPIDWARMAAFIDGEGSVLINPRRSRVDQGISDIAATFYLKLTVANTDVRLMVWLKNTFGGTFKDANTAAYYPGRNNKTAYHWGACSQRAAWILYNCMPYFIMKMEQAQIGIDLQKSLGRAFTRGAGKRLPFDIVAERRELKVRLLKLKARGKEMQPEQQARIDEVSDALVKEN
jgi:hypothetical protein